MDSFRGKIICGGLLLFIFIIGEIYTFSLHFEARARILRAHFVILLQVILYFISKLLWNNLFHLKERVSSATEAASTSSKTHFKDWKTNLTAWNVICFSYLVLCHLSYMTNFFLIKKDPHWFSMLSYCALGIYFQLATGLFAVKLVKFILYIVGNLTHSHRPGQNIISKQKTATLVFIYALLASSIGLYAASRVPGVKRVTVPIRDLPLMWEQMRIVQISDIHLGPTVGHSKLSAIVQVINELHPDLVVMTGDLVDSSVSLLSGSVSPLSEIRSKYGNYFVTGNHEYYTGDVDNWFIKLRKDLGFLPLHNTNVKLFPENGNANDVICLAGTDDIEASRFGYTGHGFDLDGALKSCDPKHPVIVLAHQPRAAKYIVDSDYRADLVLSGHTHGGQFFPMMIGVYIVNPFFAGLYHYNEKNYVYVSQGTQYWGVPLRLGSTMEITEIILKASISSQKT